MPTTSSQRRTTGRASVPTPSDHRFGGLSADEHRNQANRVRSAAQALTLLPDMALRYEALAKAHELAASRLEATKH